MHILPTIYIPLPCWTVRELLQMPLIAAAGFVVMAMVLIRHVHAMRPSRCVLLQREKRPAHRIDRDVVKKRRETHPWFPLHKLPYPVGLL